MGEAATTLLVLSMIGLFAVLWIATTALLPHFMGWVTLEKLAPDKDPSELGSPLDTLRFQGLYLGKGKLGASYRGCVTFEVYADGLRVSIWKLFAPFSKPIFIPFEAMQTEEARVFTFRTTRMKIGPGGEYWMTLGPGTAKSIASASNGAFKIAT